MGQGSTYGLEGTKLEPFGESDTTPAFGSFTTKRRTSTALLLGKQESCYHFGDLQGSGLTQTVSPRRVTDVKNVGRNGTRGLAEGVAPPPPAREPLPVRLSDGDFLGGSRERSPFASKVESNTTSSTVLSPLLSLPQTPQQRFRYFTKSACAIDDRTVSIDFFLQKPSHLPFLFLCQCFICASHPPSFQVGKAKGFGRTGTK